MSKIIKICIVFIVLFIYSSESGARIIAVGDLPEGYDPSLVLREGRTIRVAFDSNINNINSEIPFGAVFLPLVNDIYDDSGQFRLLAKLPNIACLYEVSVEQDKIKINISVMEMILYPDVYSISILFSDPPRYRTAEERAPIQFPPFLPGARQKNMDMRQRSRETISQMRDQIFISPTISAELVFGIESEDHMSEYEKITFGENASGDRTIIIRRGYQFDLQVRKDILFSGPFIGEHWSKTGAGLPIYQYWLPPP